MTIASCDSSRPAHASPGPGGSQRPPGWPRALLAAAIAVVAWLPRGAELDRFATIDEPLWLMRSANFACALFQGDLAATYQSEHPGVTAMWAGAAGILLHYPQYTDSCLQQVDADAFEDLLREKGRSPIALLAAGRSLVALTTTAVLAVAFIYAWQLLGPLPSGLGFLLVALDPYLIAHSRLLHLDALLSVLLLLSLLAFIAHLRRRRRTDLIVSGVAAGLAALTKAPAAVIVPIVALLAAARAITARRRNECEDTRRAASLALRPLVAWGGVAVLVVFALWPAMWMRPAATLSAVTTATSGYAASGHGSPVFFNGGVVADGRLGAAFWYYYPLTYLWHTTPTVIAGLLAAAVALRVKRSAGTESRSTALFSLLLFVLIYAAFLTIGAKKGDRYLLPAYGPLAMTAGVGWAEIASWLREASQRRLAQVAAVTALIAALVAQAWVVAPTYPYYLTYYNPLVGGAEQAPEVVQIGWGEGLDQAATYLNKELETRPLWVFAWHNMGAFSYFFEANSREIPPAEAWDVLAFQQLLNSDYVVTYVHQWQRDVPGQLLDYLALQEPEHSVWINGLEYARVYDPGDVFAVASAASEVDAVLGGSILLESFSLPRQVVGAGEIVPVAFEWRALEASGEPYKVFIHLLDGTGKLVAQHDAEPFAWLRPTDTWRQGERVTDRHGLLVPDDLSPGEYSIVAGMYCRSGERLAVRVGETAAGDSLSLGRITVAP